MVGNFGYVVNRRRHHRNNVSLFIKGRKPRGFALSRAYTENSARGKEGRCGRYGRSRPPDDACMQAVIDMVILD